MAKIKQTTKKTKTTIKKTRKSKQKRCNSCGRYMK